MIIDCDSCQVRGIACGDCVIGVLLGTPSVPARPVDAAATPSAVHSGQESERVALRVETPSGASTVQFDATERRALDLLAAAGLIPRLRLVASEPRRTPGSAGTAHADRDAV
jgi:hypothetical protein